jgi:hypothetical protein
MAVGNQTPADVASDYATLSFIVQQKLSEVQTLTLCRVVDCTNDGGIVPVGTLTVQPLVNLMSGDRVAFKYKPVYKIPYLRIQGGTNAVIMDPKPGDIGLVGFCSRDISAVKASKDVANPGSFRLFSMADGVWIGGCLNGTPEQYVVFNDDGIKIVSPTLIELQAPTINLKGDVAQTDGDVTMSQTLTVQSDIETPGGDVTAGNIKLKTHKHSGVTPGGGTSGGPVP